MNIVNYDQHLEESHHPENFEPNCPVCGGLTRWGECISNNCDLTKKESEDYDTERI